ncbi:MAG: nickel pincer cofactor biosynthesis protein LarB [Candidatus Omnitrophota bacterium]|jgi:NCAIR mutase (PurE)-related protein
MEKTKLRKLLKKVEKGTLSPEKALENLKAFPYDDLGFAKIDTHRDLRKGVPEVILCEGKTIDQIKGIFANGKKSSFMMATRADRKIYSAVKKIREDAVFHEKARIIFAGKRRKKKGKTIAVVTAGTSDIPVAEEAAITAEIIGNKVERIYDIGVAGIHRLLGNKKKLTKANVVIVVAGMEGALASIVGGVVERPVIAVPTSVGYGANFKGITPLLTMLNACAPGIAVVNIDNGFGAGYMASLINKK